MRNVFAAVHWGVGYVPDFQRATIWPDGSGPAF